MLNPTLFQELCRVFQTNDISVGNDEQLGTYSCPQYRVPTSIKKKPKKYADVASWGETYHLRCPVCEDRKKRLYFSHLFWSYVKAKGATGTRYRCGNLYRCQNEHCDLSEYFQQFNKRELEKVCVSERPPGDTHRIVSWEQGVLPPQAYPIVDARVPHAARRYLEDRGYDLNELYRNFQVMYATDGMQYHLPEELTEEEITAGKTPKYVPEFKEDRIIIPITQGLRNVSWQARAVGEHHKKYLFPSGCRKSHYVYNLDEALHYDGIVICEGITDVWTLGQDAVALFGKTMSPAQKHILSTVWSFHGCATIMLDSDASTEADKIARELREDPKAFPRGVRVARLPKGDPGDYSEDDLNRYIEEAWHD
jgi:hypothetical protein